MKKTVEKFLESTKEGSFHRYKSWEHCYEAFGNEDNSSDTLALHLAFYLASWGMYRGSSGLLWKDYKVHIEAVEIIRRHSLLRNDYKGDIPPLKEVLVLFDELRKCYSKLKYYNGKEEKVISATDTLISKIILGTLGCLPAFDRYFNLGLFEKEYSVVNENSLQQVWSMAVKMKPEIENIQDWAFQSYKVQYPVMKIIDMYYWQKGFDFKKNKDI
jgi:hypothetical protein